MIFPLKKLAALSTTVIFPSEKEKTLADSEQGIHLIMNC